MSAGGELRVSNSEAEVRGDSILPAQCTAAGDEGLCFGVTTTSPGGGEVCACVVLSLGITEGAISHWARTVLQW